MNFNLTLLGQTISMIIFVAIAMKIWPMLIAKLDQRRKTIADGIAAGEKGQRELAEARHGAEDILQDARKKAAQVDAMAHKRSGELIAEARQQANNERERLVAAAHTEIMTSESKARDALRDEVATLVIAGAAKVLGNAVDVEVNAELLDQLAAELERQARTHG